MTSQRWLAALITLELVLGAVSACGVSPDDRRVETRVRTVPSTVTTTTTVPPTTSTTAQGREIPTRQPRASRASRAPVVVDDAFWRRLSDCESGSNPQRTSASGKYHGAFQFSLSSWWAAGGEGVPEDHDYEYQLAVAKRWAAMTNPWRQWPVCWPRAARG